MVIQKYKEELSYELGELLKSAERIVPIKKEAICLKKDKKQEKCILFYQVRFKFQK